MKPIREDKRKKSRFPSYLIFQNIFFVISKESRKIEKKNFKNKTMKIIISLIVVLAIFQVIYVVSARPHRSASIEDEDEDEDNNFNDKSRNEHETLVDYVRSILHDPAFNSLEFQEQYEIISFVHMALEQHLMLVLDEEERERALLEKIENKMEMAEN